LNGRQADGVARRYGASAHWQRDRRRLCRRPRPGQRRRISRSASRRSRDEPRRRASAALCDGWRRMAADVRPRVTGASRCGRVRTRMARYSTWRSRIRPRRRQMCPELSRTASYPSDPPHPTGQRPPTTRPPDDRLVRRWRHPMLLAEGAQTCPGSRVPTCQGRTLPGSRRANGRAPHRHSRRRRAAGRCPQERAGSEQVRDRQSQLHYCQIRRPVSSPRGVPLPGRRGPNGLLRLGRRGTR
jgi:hypothetical protein